MKRSTTTYAGRLALLAAIFGLLAPGTTNLLAGGNPNPGIAPINSNSNGKSYPQWAAAWLQWAYSIPADVNPLLDSIGENSAEGQEGPVWFLAGNFGGTSVREVSVPVGKALFFPIMYGAWVQFPDDPPFTIPELRAFLQAFTDDASLYCEIDGQGLKNLAGYRVESVVFTTTFPEGNIFGAPAGNYGPSLENGYYLMVDPLKRGAHTIRFLSETADHTFSLDVTYHLTVQ